MNYNCQAFEEITRIKNSIDISFSNPGESTTKHALTISRNITFQELKNIIAEKLNLDVGEFLVYRGLYEHKTELRGYEDPVGDQGVSNNRNCLLSLENL